MNQDLPEEFNYHMKRVKFLESEDQQLIKLVQQCGTKCWSFIATQMPGRTPRQCRDRWNHYLAPQTNTTKWTTEEDKMIIKMVKEVGKQWSKIASMFHGRTGIAVRNRFCKLSRQKNADPALKRLLNEGSKKKLKGIEVIEQPPCLCNNNINYTPTNTVKLPSVTHLLQLSSEYDDSMKLWPLFGNNNVIFPDLKGLGLLDRPPLNLPAPAPIYK